MWEKVCVCEKPVGISLWHEKMSHRKRWWMSFPLQKSEKKNCFSGLGRISRWIVGDAKITPPVSFFIRKKKVVREMETCLLVSGCCTMDIFFFSLLNKRNGVFLRSFRQVMLHRMNENTRRISSDNKRVGAPTLFFNGIFFFLSSPF